MWVHRSQLCLNGKYTCISRQLLTEQLFLPVPRFVLKGKPHFSFLSSPARLVQAQRDCSTCQGSALQHQQTGRGWMPQELVFYPALHHIPYTHTLLFWTIPAGQQTRSELGNTANLASPLFTRRSASVSSAFPMLIRLSRHRDPHTTLQHAKPHIWSPP